MSRFGLAISNLLMPVLFQTANADTTQPVPLVSPKPMPIRPDYSAEIHAFRLFNIYNIY
jgi:hypothetical protein